MQLNNWPQKNMKIKNMITSPLRNSVSRLPLRRGLLLIPLVLVWFGRSEPAKAQVYPNHRNPNDMGYLVQRNVEMNRRTLAMFSAQNAYRAELGAQLGLALDSSSASSNREPPYQPQPAKSQFPITATDFKPTTARIVPVEWVRVMRGLSPNQRGEMVEANNLFLDNFERRRRKNNVATSYAWLACVSLNVVKGGEFLGSDAEDRIVHGFNDSLANNLQFDTTDPRIKQCSYEKNIITAGWSAVYSTGQNGVQAQQVAREPARVVLKQLLGIETR